MKTTLILKIMTLALLAFFATACENSQQRVLYDKAFHMEQEHGGDRSMLTVQAYREAIKIAPSTKLAEKAQERLDRVQANHNSLMQLMEQQEIGREQKKIRTQLEIQDMNRPLFAEP